MNHSVVPSPDTTPLSDLLRASLDEADQGRTVAYEQVREWLLSWGSGDEKTPPEPEKAA
jgi:hypothetical protein